ncbi:dihydrolipoamide acetyltransferase family protein [Compostibacter hankyongensis]|uniref:Dihydrolipoamide acetyltransferase component of pyruvate dehydrogenase complex n=1 Tax=Compostibacter hankyongensis TaxID=1007089 RepID=A0ABP8G307_9BACT
MAVVDLIMPKLGESIMEATILHWHKQPGDKVKADETVLEIATDKVDSEVPAIVDGEIRELLFRENDVVPVGAVIARIETSASADSGAEDVLAGEALDADVFDMEGEEEGITEEEETEREAPVQQEGRFYSPLVLKIARDEGVSMAELEQVPGTGHEGRVTKKDMLEYVSGKRSGKPAAASGSYDTDSRTAPERSVTVSSPLSYRGNVEIIEMDRMRKLIAAHMVQSKQTSPHVTSFSEADVTNLVQWRTRVKKDFEQREGEKITFMPLFIEAIVRCIKRFPLINSSVDGDRIIVKKDINIGMATALPNGNLIVPVIRNADQLNLTGIARQVNRLAAAARNGKLQPEDTQEGTFTLTNVGTFGSLSGTPIINQPQSAILAVGIIKKRPMVVETAQGDSIAIRHMMYLSMSYDHRIIDGSLGATFLTAVAQELEHFDPARNF